MGLAETSLHVLVGLTPRADLTATLVYRNREIPTVVSVRLGTWAADGPAVATTVNFGPYPQPVTFDTIRLHHGGQLLVDLPRRTDMNLDPGDRFEEQIFLDGMDS